MKAIIKFQFRDDFFYFEAHSFNLFRSLFIKDRMKTLEYIHYEYIYKIIEHFVKQVPELKLVDINVDLMLPLLQSMQEHLIINEYIYGDIVASKDTMFNIAYYLNIPSFNYIKLTKMVDFSLKKTLLIHDKEYQIKVNDILHVPKFKKQYIVFNITYGSYNFECYLNNQCIRYLLQEVFKDQSFIKSKTLDVFYLEAVADIIISQINYQFNLSCILEKAYYKVIDNQTNYLSVQLVNNDFKTIILLNNWDIFKQFITKDDNSKLKHHKSINNAVYNNYKLPLQYPLLAGDLELTIEEINNLAIGDIVLLNNCYMPDRLAISLDNESNSAVFFGLQSNNKSLCLEVL